MPLSPTSRLGLTQPDGAVDLLNTVDDTIRTNNTILDNAALAYTGVFASRPAAGSVPAGTIYVATDTGATYVTAGGSWLDVAPGTTPVGTMADYLGATDPADTRWLIADGRAISQATYAALFSKWTTDGLVTIFNTMAGQAAPAGGTFRLPKMAGRGTIAAGTATGANGATAHTFGEVAGEETHVLTIPEMPSHNHTLALTSGTGFGGSAANVGTTPQGSETTSSTGGGGAHNNMAPFVAVNKIVRVL